MSDQVWIYNPDLPGQDIKVERSALGTNYAHSGWRIRDDQADPIEVLDEAEPPVDPVVPSADTPADVETTTTKKGR